MQANSNDVSLKPRDLAIAHLLLRLLIGVNFFNHGIVRIGNIPGFVEQTVKTLAGSYFPEPLIRLNSYLVPIIELVVGILITVGFSTRIALIVTSGLMIMLMMGVTSAQKWDIASSQFIYGIVLFILLATCRYNWYSIDSWLRRKQRRIEPAEREEVLSYRDDPR
jgi:thiosulfate dehydrogenase (quinone) large subunit